MATAASSLMSGAQTDLQLVPPSRQGGLTIMETLWHRHSDREFSSKPLSSQDLSDLLFAASGINRADSEKLTAPSALNTQEIDLYVFNREGVYRYNPRGHKLQRVIEGDHRSALAGTPQFSQDFVLEAPMCLLLVGNPQKFENQSEMIRSMAMVDGGIMAENICLFCAGRGLATVPRATMDREALARLLNLPDQAIPVLNLPVGYPK